MSLEAQSRAIQQKVPRNLNFGIARVLTNTAKFAAAKLEQQLPTIFAFYEASHRVSVCNEI
jgi:hypothetical protein